MSFSPRGGKVHSAASSSLAFRWRRRAPFVPCFAPSGSFSGSKVIWYSPPTVPSTRAPGARKRFSPSAVDQSSKTSDGRASRVTVYSMA